MIIKLIAAPLIGALIGYCTNWLAVKMLFWPREEKYIGKMKIPLTPGVIPQGKARIARAVGNVINEQLLTKEAVEQRLLSEQVVAQVRKTVKDTMDEFKDGSTSIRQVIAQKANQEKAELAISDLQTLLVGKALYRLQSANVGEKVANELISQLNDSVKETFIGKMFGDSMLDGMKPSIANAIDNYLENNAEFIIMKTVKNETETILNMPAASVVNGIENAGYDIDGVAEDIYKKVVKQKAAAAVATLDIGTIARESIENMDNRQLEELIMATMKTELRAIVSLGAAIGLLMGLINMIIYLL